MTWCWDHDPARRPTFEEILSYKSDAFANAAAEGLGGLRQNHLKSSITKLWVDLSVTENANLLSLPWDPFQKEFLQIIDETKGIDILSALLNIDENKQRVTWENFHQFLYIFGPPESGMLSEISKLLQKEWFWGDISPIDASRILQSQRPGHFLVRFSQNKSNVVETPSNLFTLSGKKRDGTVQHKRLSAVSDYKQLRDTIRKEKRQYQLTKPPIERPSKYAILFKKSPPIPVSPSYYISAGILPPGSQGKDSQFENK